MARTSFVAVVSLSSLVALELACSGKDPYKPGEAVGTFHVTSKLTKTSCGTVPDPWEFDVRLRHEGTTLYWVQGGAPIQGPVDTQSRAQLKSETTQVLRQADARTQTASCAVTRLDTLDVTLTPSGSIANAQKFSGTLAYRFQPTNDSDCGDQLLTTGGDYEALPCDVAYTVEGVLTAAGEARSPTSPTK